MSRITIKKPSVCKYCTTISYEREFEYCEKCLTVQYCSNECKNKDWVGWSLASNLSSRFGSKANNGTQNKGQQYDCNVKHVQCTINVTEYIDRVMPIILDELEPIIVKGFNNFIIDSIHAHTEYFR